MFTIFFPWLSLFVPPKIEETSIQHPGIPEIFLHLFREIRFSGKSEDFQTLKSEKERMKQRGALRTQKTAKDLADLLIGAWPFSVWQTWEAGCGKLGRIIPRIISLVGPWG